jgi:hypothetical protein
MITVVFVLIVLSLSSIFAYLALSNKKDKKTPEIKDVAKSSEKTQEDEDTSLTATAQPIETEPPEEEDPGTCETTGDWAMSGECQADGTAIFTQTYKESKPGACPSNDKARVKPCCYQKGDWTDTTGCNEKGRKTQKQTTINCAENFKTREVNCPYVGPWSKTGGCGLDGKQHFIRNVINSVEPKQKTASCSYVGSWNRLGGCGPDGKQSYNRIVINSNQPTTKVEDCCHMGNWKNKECRTDNTLRQVRTRTKGCGGPSTETKDIRNGCRYQKCRVQTWKHSNFHGHTWTISDSVSNVRHDDRSRRSKHDEVTSYKVWGGNCNATAYEHADYRGRTVPMYYGGRNVPGWFNDKLSSIRINHYPIKL